MQVGTRVLTTDPTPWSDLTSLGAGFVVKPAQAGREAALLEFLARPEWPVECRARLAAEIHRRFLWETVGPPDLRLY